MDYAKVARATAGFTGAELMNLMNQAAILAARQGQPCIAEAEVFEALEKVHREKMSGGASAVNFEQARGAGGGLSGKAAALLPCCVALLCV